MDKKTCFKCLEELPLIGFYKHREMADGHVNKCKECTKKDVINNRVKNIEYYRKYDRDRGCRVKPGYTKWYRDKYPNKYLATTMVGNALKAKKLFQEPCGVCGSEKRAHAHHDDYAKPLNVRWLCAAHHRQWHVKNGEAKNP
jgi:hypothetical protein